MLVFHHFHEKVLPQSCYFQGYSIEGITFSKPFYYLSVQISYDLLRFYHHPP
jgi:hypothetical protein